MPFGTQTDAQGGTHFRLWAPSCPEVRLELVGADGSLFDSLPMTPGQGGWHELNCPAVGAGRLYRFRVREDLAVPDPGSRFNPLDVHGPSEVIDPLAHEWQAVHWKGRPWHSAVVYELHVGTFTSQGRFDSAIAKLPLLRELGITAVELMPVADFSGARNWGYDGVLPFAPDAAYGRPEDLKRLVDAAHALGMLVLLDVVYNHFGPDGNYLSAYCPEFFNPKHHTPWGPAVNFDGPHNETVRRFFVDNAVYWIEEYRFDGLRLDAVHAMRDDSSTHVVAQIAQEFRRLRRGGRELHLILENEHNQALLLARDAAGRPRVATAQWNDDWHHAAHVLATGETEGYYADYEVEPALLLGKALAEGFAYQGQPSRQRGGKPRGQKSDALESSAFVNFLQNHDQTGNRAFGERLDMLASASRVDALLACLLLSPQVPMLFMGEEFAASTPFYYFCDAAPDLATKISAGRRAEFATFSAFGDPKTLAAIPDPNLPETFTASKLDWREWEAPAGLRRRELVGHLLALRAEHLMPRLSSHGGGGTYHAERGCITVDWVLGDRIWSMRMNLGERPVRVTCRRDEQQIYAVRAGRESGSGRSLAPDGVLVVIASRDSA